jgi:hypothetical protein
MNSAWQPNLSKINVLNRNFTLRCAIASRQDSRLGGFRLFLSGLNLYINLLMQRQKGDAGYVSYSAAQ